MTLSRLSESAIQHALKALDWRKLDEYLTPRALQEHDADFLADQLLRCNWLVQRYPNAPREAKRDSLFAQIAQLALTKIGSQARAKINSALSEIHLVERGYRALLAQLDDSVGQDQPSEIISAALFGAAYQIHAATTAVRTQARSASIVDKVAFSLCDENGTSYSVDDLINLNDMSTAMIASFCARRAEWFDAEGAIVLPKIVRPTEDQVGKFLSLQRQAEAWAFWRSIEERRRLDGGSLERRYSQDTPASDIQVVVYRPTAESLAFHKSSLAGYDRLNTEVASISHELFFRSNVRAKAKGLSQRTKLYPNEFINLTEIASAHALDLMLSTNIAADRTLYLGLRLVEWLRGYSALALLVDDAYGKHFASDALLIELSPRTLNKHLCRLGFTERKARLFLNLVTFKKTSVEVIDEPLFRMANGHYLLFGPSLLGAVPARILLSKLARADIYIEERGTRFEAMVKSWLHGWGFDAKTFKERRDGEDYEYDVVMRWQDYIFVFECKSQGLIAPNTAGRFRARQRFKSYIAQTKRLAEALKQYPDILDAHFGVTSSPRIIVPCLMHSMPFGLPGSHDGVFCTDAPSLGCFFEQGAITLSATETLPGKPSIQHVLDKRQLWSGLSPLPEDFLKYLAECPLHSMALGQIEVSDIRLPIGEAFEAQAPEVFSKPVSVQDLAELFASDVSTARQNIESLAARMSELRSRNDS
jgi:hypothetical protein